MATLKLYNLISQSTLKVLEKAIKYTICDVQKRHHIYGDIENNNRNSYRNIKSTNIIIKFPSENQ